MDNPGGDIGRQKGPQNLTRDQIAVSNSEKRLLAKLVESGSPGMIICVAKAGKVVWRAAFGYCDVENMVPCNEFSAMKIASISKCIFATTMVAPLLDQGKLKLESSVHQFLNKDEFPKQTWDGKQFDITVGQLLSHTSGIRHYIESDESIKPIGSPGSKKIFQTDQQFERKDLYTRSTFRDVIDSLNLFKNDTLANKPGEYNYTTYGYSVLSAIVQKILQKEPNHGKTQVEDSWVRTLAKCWNMRDTHLDYDEVLIPMRARHYRRDGKARDLINAPFIDSSYKWAGGGLVSNTTDLVQFGNKLIDIYKGRDNSLGIKNETLRLMWTKVKSSYGLGFQIADNEPDETMFYHTGTSIGSSSILAIKPESEIVVAILANIPTLNLTSLASYIAQQFR